MRRRRMAWAVTMTTVAAVPARAGPPLAAVPATGPATRPVVAVWTRAVATAGVAELALPCDLLARRQTAVYPGVRGIVARRAVDVGQRVAAGDVLAVISATDADAQLAADQAGLDRAKADVGRAVADADLARLTLDRYVEVQKDSPGSVSAEDVGVRRQASKAAAASVAQARAAVRQAEAAVAARQAAVAAERVSAPFAGVVTARTIDVGDLVSPDRTADGQELFDVTDPSAVRAFVEVPQALAGRVVVGGVATLSFAADPGHGFAGRVAATAGVLDPHSRTMRVRVDLLNPRGQLLPGAYGTVQLPLTTAAAAAAAGAWVRVPATAMIFSPVGGIQVATLDDAGRVRVRAVQPARDDGAELELASGVAAGDRVIVNPGPWTVAGAAVDAREGAALPATRPAASPVVDTTTLPPPTAQP